MHDFAPTVDKHGLLPVDTQIELVFNPFPKGKCLLI